MKKNDKEKYYTYKLNMTLLNILAIVLFIVVGSIVFIIERNDNYYFNGSFIMLFIMMIGWLILHELLHGIGFGLFKSVDKKNITFGMYLEKGVFFCMCKQKIKKKVILTSLLFPVTIIGLFTLIIGMIINNYVLVFLSIMNIVSSIGDLVMTWYFLKAPNDIIYLDLDDCTSFTVLSENNLENLKVPGINLDSKGEYDEEKMQSHDKRRLMISNWSYALLVLTLILVLILILN